MKLYSIVFALPLAAFAVDTVDSTSYLQSANVSPGPPQIRKDAIRKYFKFGPYTLKPNTPSTGKSKGGGMFGDGDTQTFMASPTGANFCGDCTVLAGMIVLRYPDGSIANTTNGVYIHHILTSGMKQTQPFVRTCMPSPPGFVGNGDDNMNEPVLYAAKDGSLQSGYWVSPADRFSANCRFDVLVNYNKEPKKVEIWYDLEYLPGHVGKSIKSALISASCNGIKVSKTSAVNTTSQPMAFLEDGHVVLARGHLHDGGVAMHLRVDRKNGGTYRCTSKAIYGGKLATGAAGGHGHADTIANMENCNPHPIKVAQGDTMTMTSEYNVALHPLRDTGHGADTMPMGMFRIIFAPDR